MNFDDLASKHPECHLYMPTPTLLLQEQQYRINKQKDNDTGRQHLKAKHKIK